MKKMFYYQLGSLLSGLMVFISVIFFVYYFSQGVIAVCPIIFCYLGLVGLLLFDKLMKVKY